MDPDKTAGCMGCIFPSAVKSQHIVFLVDDD